MLRLEERLRLPANTTCQQYRHSLSHRHSKLHFINVYIVCIYLNPILWLQRYVRPISSIFHSEDLTHEINRYFSVKSLTFVSTAVTRRCPCKLSLLCMAPCPFQPSAIPLTCLTLELQPQGPVNTLASGVQPCLSFKPLKLHSQFVSIF